MHTTTLAKTITEDQVGLILNTSNRNQIIKYCRVRNFIHISLDLTLQVTKLVKEGDVNKLENAVLLGKGKLIIGKKAWNDKMRKFLKSVPDLMVSKIVYTHKTPLWFGYYCKVKNEIDKVFIENTFFTVGY